MLILDVDGTMTDGGIYITEKGEQFKKFNSHDGIGIKMALKAGIDVGIISHSIVTEMVTARANMLGLKHFYVGQRPKLEVLQEWHDEHGLNFEEIAFMGDDVNDLEIMEKVGLSVCPANAVDKVKSAADIILKKSGGDGAVREFIDQYLLG